MDQEQVFQDIARLAARSNHQHTPVKDMDVEEAQRRIELEQENAAARFGYSANKRISSHGKGRRTSKTSRAKRVRNEQSEGDGLDDLERMFAMTSHEEPACNSHPDEDDMDEDAVDDINRPITVNELSVHGIAGEMDVEWGGMYGALAVEEQWRNSSDAERAALQQTVQSARRHSDFYSRFHPQEFEELARAQQELFQTAGQGNASQDSYGYQGNGNVMDMN